ncbi:hypothetical protein RSAG8_13554, partial [Rhizoctonia solani AG-8 WAC10335]
MIEQLRSAGDQLRAAWDNYCRVYSSIKSYQTSRKAPHADAFPAEFSRQLDTELAFISSYQSKIQEIKAAIGHVRNYTPSLVSINTLPPEILTRIFQLVLVLSCDLHAISFDEGQYHPTYPDYLAQVCVLWRRTTISCYSLWCRIYLWPYEPYYEGLPTRADRHVARAGNLPIELRVAENLLGGLERKFPDYIHLHEIVSPISDRVETLEIFVSESFRGLHGYVFKTLLLSQQSSLKKLVICSGPYCVAFIHARGSGESDDENDEFGLNLTENQLENAFAPLKVLHLHGVFPLWSGVAYHGLVDLRLLLGAECWPCIERVELITILKSSPRLRILHVELALLDWTPNTEQLAPVHLPDLQVVRVVLNIGEGLNSCSGVLQLLAPGSRPLRLSFGGSYEPDSVLVAEWERFFVRARVARFYTSGAFPPMNVLLRHAAHLELVVFDN